MVLQVVCAAAALAIPLVIGAPWAWGAAACPNTVAGPEELCPYFPEQHRACAVCNAFQTCVECQEWQKSADKAVFRCINVQNSNKLCYEKKVGGLIQYAVCTYVYQCRRNTGGVGPPCLIDTGRPLQPHSVTVKTDKGC
jgi:hypothetical protein